LLPQRIKLIGTCLLLLVVACEPIGPPLSASHIVAIAPLPGRAFTSAYLTLNNNSDTEIRIHRVSSPDFAKVEIHENRIVDDVVRMRRLESVIVGAEASVVFEAGGKHLMLIDPTNEVEVGKTITLQFEYNADGMLIISVPLTERM
jgi:copper(I)-binding protein